MKYRLKADFTFEAVNLEDALAALRSILTVSVMHPSKDGYSSPFEGLLILKEVKDEPAGL